MAKVDETHNVLPSTRREILIGGAGAGAALTLGLGSPAVLAQANKPIKIGILMTLTGGLAAQCEQNIAATKMFFEKRNWEVAGRKIELVIEDDQANPQTGRNKARKMIESDAVDMLTGPQNSAVAQGIVDYLKQANALFIISGAGQRNLTREKRYPLLFRVSCSTYQTTLPMGDYLIKNYGKRIVGAFPDYSGGRDAMDELKLVLHTAGAEVIKEIFPPLGNKDFGPYFNDIKAAKPDAVFVFFPGADGVRFVQQWDQFGLKGQIPLTGLGFTVEQDVLPAQGQSAVGIVSSLHYASTLDNPENRAFAAEYKAKMNLKPGVTAEYGWVLAQAVTAALEKTGGDVSDKQKFADALVEVEFNAPRGPFKFDPKTHNPVMNEYVRRVEERNGEIDNYVVATYPNTFDPLG
jgi:branched-chain amino acid transport system substrate-binding protein